MHISHTYQEIASSWRHFKQILLMFRPETYLTVTITEHLISTGPLGIHVISIESSLQSHHKYTSLSPRSHRFYLDWGRDNIPVMHISGDALVPPEHCCEYFAPSWRKTLRNWACTGITDNGLRAGTNSNLATRRIPYHQDLSRAYFSMLRSRLQILLDSEENEASAEFRLPLVIYTRFGPHVASVLHQCHPERALELPQLTAALSDHITTLRENWDAARHTSAVCGQQRKEWGGEKDGYLTGNKIAPGWIVNSTNILKPGYLRSSRVAMR